MSENKNIPTELYFNAKDLQNGIISEYCQVKTIYYDTPYILKSKYDTLLKEKEELEKKLQIITDSDIKEVLKKRR